MQIFVNPPVTVTPTSEIVSHRSYISTKILAWKIGEDAKVLPLTRVKYFGSVKYFDLVVHGNCKSMTFVGLKQQFKVCELRWPVCVHVRDCSLVNCSDHW